MPADPADPVTAMASTPPTPPSGDATGYAVEAVIFDLDDTLLDHRGSSTAALSRWLPTLGSVADDRAVAAWFDAEERHFPRWSAGDITSAEQRRRRLRDVLPAVGLGVGGEAELDRLFDDYLAHYRESWTGFDDVRAAVDRLHGAGLRMAVLTNGLDAQQRAKVEALGIGDVVRPVVTAEELGVAKPDPAAYLAVCERLGVAPAAALHVGDRYDLDVTGARAAGLRAVHLDRRGLGPTDEPDRISSLDELRIPGPRPAPVPSGPP